MNTMPLITIVTPSLNQGNYIEETIRSVVLQDYPYVEYIVIDGGSKDNTIDVIKQYKDKITYWHSIPDHGQANAINQGFQAASGSIVAWLNSDDLYLPGTLYTVAKHFIAEPETDIVYGDCVYVDEKGSFVRYFTECEHYNRSRLLNYTDFISQPSAFFSKELLMKVGMLDENLRYTLDWDLWCRFAKEGARFKYIEEVLSANREHSATKTISGGIDRLKEIWKLQMKYKEGKWPHAFFGFLATDFVNAGIRNNQLIIKTMLVYLGRTIAFMAPKAKWFWWKTGALKKTKYGLYPHSTRIQGSATILFPYYKIIKEAYLQVCFGIDKNLNKNTDKIHVNVKIENIYTIETKLDQESLTKDVKIKISKKPYI
jgi:glycosyltransferase involved in cell wall biosynthesis